MSISEQIKELRIAAVYKEHSLKKLLEQAADTIESLSAKLETANKELERWHTDKINDKIKNPFAWTSTLCCHNCDHKDEYIEELEAADMERSAEDCGGWIPCSERLPKEYCHCLVTRRNDYEDGYDTDVREDVFIELEGVWDWHSKHEGLIDDIVAWQPLPEPYHEP